MLVGSRRKECCGGRAGGSEYADVQGGRTMLKRKIVEHLNGITRGLSEKEEEGKKKKSECREGYRLGGENKGGKSRCSYFGLLDCWQLRNGGEVRSWVGIVERMNVGRETKTGAKPIRQKE